MLLRDLDKERKAVGRFQGEIGRDPSSHADWLKVQSFAYGADPNALPDELKTINAKFATSQTAGGLNKTGAPTPTDPFSKELEGIKPRLRSAEKVMEGLSAPSDTLNVLQEAIKIKQGTADMSIGGSEIFKKAGVGGYGALMQSLATRRTEIENNFSNFQNLVGTMAGHYKDKANFAIKNYERIKSEYDDVLAKVEKIEDEEREYSTYLKKLKAKAEIDKETYLFEQRNKVFAPKDKDKDKDTEKFYNDIDSSLEDLRKGANWGEVWNKLKAKYQPQSDKPIDDVLDKLLNKEFWGQEGAYRKFKESGGTKETLIAVPSGSGG